MSPAARRVAPAPFFLLVRVIGLSSRYASAQLLTKFRYVPSSRADTAAMMARDRHRTDAGSHRAELAQKRRMRVRRSWRDGVATTPRMPLAMTAQLITRAPTTSAAAANSRLMLRRARPYSTFRTRAVSTQINQKHATHACDSRGRARTASGVTPIESTARSTEEPYMPEQASLLAHPDTDVTDHPMVRDVNEEHQQNLSAVEKACKKIADATGAPVALALAIVSQ